MAKRTSVTLKDLIDRQRELVAAGDANAVKQLARLEDLATETKAQTGVLQDIRASQPDPKITSDAQKILKQDRILQVVQTIEARKADKDDDRIASASESLEEISKKGLLDKSGDGLNANVLKLLKAMGASTSGTAPQRSNEPVNRPQKLGKQRATVAGRLGEQSKAGKLGATGYVNQEFKKLGTLGGWFDTSEGKGQGLIGQAVMRAQEKGDFVKDQLATGATTNKDLAAKRFDKVNDLRLEGGRLLEETQAMRGRGLSEDQIARTGVFDRQKATDDKIAIANPLYRENRLAEQKNQDPQRPTKGSPVTDVEAPTLGAPVSASGTSEQVSENLRMMADQNETLKQIEENTRGMAGPAGVSKTPPPAQPQPEGSQGILGDIGDIFGGKGAGGLLKKGGALLGRAGKGILSAGKSVASAASPLLSQAGGLATRAIAGAGGASGIAAAAAPIAAVYGAANVVDYGLGKFGVGKDAEGNDLQVNKEQDDANWKKMSWSQKLQSGVARGIEKVGGFVGLGNVAQEAAASRVKNETEYFAKKEAGGSTSATPVGSDTNSIEAMQADRDAFAKKGPATDSAQSQKAYEKVLAAKDRAIAAEKQKSGLAPSRLARSDQMQKEKEGIDQEVRARSGEMGPEVQKQQLALEKWREDNNSRAVGDIPPKPVVNYSPAKANPVATSESSKFNTGYKPAVVPNIDVSIPEPRSADAVYNKSSENAAAAQQPAPQAPVIISAPSSTNTSTTQNIMDKGIARNPESSWQSYNKSRYAF